MMAVAVLITLAICQSRNQTIVGKKPAPTTTSYSYSLTVSANKSDKASIVVMTTPLRTEMRIDGKKPIVNPVLYKYYRTGAAFKIQCQPERGVLFISHGRDEVQVWVSPIDTSTPQRLKSVLIGRKKGWVEQGTTEITYSYHYRSKSADGKRQYEIVQEDVETNKITKAPAFFSSAVNSFKEVR